MMTAALAVLALVFGAAGLAHLLAPAPVRHSADELFTSQRKQLKQKAAESHEEIAQRTLLIGELRALQVKMRQVDAELYRSRLQRLGAGITLLERQIETEHELLREYARADQMLDVEHDAWRVAGRLEEEAVEKISARLLELEAIREANRDLQLQLEANEEVERFLQPAHPEEESLR